MKWLIKQHITRKSDGKKCGRAIDDRGWIRFVDWTDEFKTKIPMSEVDNKVNMDLVNISHSLIGMYVKHWPDEYKLE